MKIVRSVQAAIDLVQKAGAAGVWCDTYMDQIHPDYIVLETAAEAARFGQILADIKAEFAIWPPRDNRQIVLDALRTFLGRHCNSDDIKWVFKDGKWSITPEELLHDELSQKIQDEDDDWFEAQREHFASRDEDY